MDERDFPLARRHVVGGLLAAAVGTAFSAAFSRPARAANLLTDVLARATDHSLDRLAQPGAFFNDSSIRIAIPGLSSLGGLGGALAGGASGTQDSGWGNALSGVLGGSTSGSGHGLAGSLGGGLGEALTGGITRKLNDAAGAAAQHAKPVFHAAINRLTLADAPGIVSKPDGATQYLRQSAGGELHTQVRPLVDHALASTGAYRSLDKLGKASPLFAQLGLTHDALGDSVTGQALNGIFKYIGVEEARLRANPLGAAGSVLGGLFGN